MRCPHWVKPDLAVAFYDDHELNLFLNKMPTFAIGAASEYKNAAEGWGIPLSQLFPGDAALSAPCNRSLPRRSIRRRSYTATECRF